VNSFNPQSQGAIQGSYLGVVSKRSVENAAATEILGNEIIDEAMMILAHQMNIRYQGSRLKIQVMQHAFELLLERPILV
jgi:hypothetical protein